MFDLESKNPDEITINTKKVTATFNVAQSTVDAGLEVGPIQGPGEFEIGDVSIRALAVRPGSNGMTADGHNPEDAGQDGEPSPEAAKPQATSQPDAPKRTIYDVEVGGVHIGIIGPCEDGLDDLGMADILCTSSVRAVREVEPKLVVAMGNIDGMVADLKLTARAEKKLKVKNRESLPVALEVVALT